MNLIQYEPFTKIELNGRPPLILYVKTSKFFEIPEDVSDYYNNDISESFLNTPFIDSDDDLIGDNFRVIVNGLHIYCSRKKMRAFVRRYYNTYRYKNITMDDIDILGRNLITNTCEEIMK